MKKSTSLLLSGILVSGMVLGTIVTPATVNAATDDTAVTQAATKVSNLITYVDGNGKAISGLPAETLTGTVGSAITLHKGYSLYPGVDQTAVFKADGTAQTFKVIKSDQIATVTVNYIDAATNEQVGSTEVSGVVGQKVNVPAPSGSDYVLSDKDASITVQKDSTYSVDVTKNISNTVIFKTADNEQAGTATITGTKVGDVIDVASDVPAGYTASNPKVTLQSEGNTQIVTVVKAANGITPFKSTVKTNEGGYAQLYTVKGDKGLRALVGGTEWKTINQLVLSGVKYYQVSTTEWVKADDVSVVSMDADDGSTDNNTNTDTDSTTVQKADKTKVTTKYVAITKLYTQNGEVVANRGLGKNSSWLTDKMVTVDGVKMYRVATNEWIRATDIL